DHSTAALRVDAQHSHAPLLPWILTVKAASGRFVAASAADWGEFADALGRLGRLRADDPARVKEEFTKLIGALAADEAVRVLRQAGLAASVVNSVADLVREPHLWSRGDLARRPHGDGGDLVAQGVVPLLSRTPGRLGDWSRRPGSDNEAVLSTWLGYSVERIREICSPSQPG